MSEPNDPKTADQIFEEAALIKKDIGAVLAFKEELESWTPTAGGTLSQIFKQRPEMTNITRAALSQTIGSVLAQVLEDSYNELQSQFNNVLTGEG